MERIMVQGVIIAIFILLFINALQRPNKKAEKGMNVENFTVREKAN